MAQSKIFLNYRRKDSEQYVFGLGLLLDQRYPGQVFWDRDTLKPGMKYRTEIEHTLRECAVVVAVIGEQWASMKDEAGTRRIDIPNDVLRLELKIALERDIPVIPVLVGNAAMPEARDLPEELRMLTDWQAMRLSLDDAKGSLAKLFAVIEGILEERANREKAAREAEELRIRLEEEKKQREILELKRQEEAAAAALRLEQLEKQKAIRAAEEAKRKQQADEVKARELAEKERVGAEKRRIAEIHDKEEKERKEKALAEETERKRKKEEERLEKERKKLEEDKKDGGERKKQPAAAWFGVGSAVAVIVFGSLIYRSMNHTPPQPPPPVIKTFTPVPSKPLTIQPPTQDPKPTFNPKGLQTFNQDDIFKVPAPTTGDKQKISPTPLKPTPAPGTTHSKESQMVFPPDIFGKAYAAPRFTAVGKDIVIDNQTGLQWMSQDYVLVQGKFPVSWDSATLWPIFENLSKPGGYSDWRVPTVAECKTLVVNADSRQAYQKAFPTTRAVHYWTSVKDGTEKAYAYDVTDGMFWSTTLAPKPGAVAYTISVRLVRGTMKR
jgi:hypothetical protein